MSEKINLGIPDESRKLIARGLCKVLADSYTLYLKTHKYHWNVTGPMFTELHSTFEVQYTQLQTAVDDLAERIRALGEVAPGSFLEFKELTSIPESKGAPPARDMIGQLLKDHEMVAREIRLLLPEAEEKPETWQPTIS